MKKVLLLAGLAGMVAANAEAIDVTPYVGLDANYAVVDTDSQTQIVSGKDWSLSGILGARTEHYGVEAFYNAGLREHKADDHSRISGYGVDLLGFQQLGCSGNWELVGSAGLASYTLRTSNIGTDRGYAERLGAGVQYALSENTSVRAMYHHAWVNDSQLDALDEISLGVRYSF